ncbi:MAG: extracellular solute-binding protein [Sphaerochaetaceae bacterium]
MRKNIILTCIVAIATLAMAFGNGVKEEAPSNEPPTLRIAWWGSQTRHDRTLKVLDMYTQKTGVKFEAEYMPFDGYFTKLNTLIASNDEYDLIQLGGNFPTYIDHLEPLDPYIKSGVIDVSGTTTANLATTALNGVQYGISNGINTYGIAYDPALFAKAGVSEPTENWTWADYEKACMTIHEKLGIFGSSKFEDFFLACTMGIPQNNLKRSFFTTDGKALNFTDSTPIFKYLDMKKRLVQAGAYPNAGQINEIKDIEGDYLVTGDAAMTWVATNQFTALSKAAGRKLKLATVPRMKADGSVGVAMQSSQMFAISKNSKYKEEAAKFLNFFAFDTEANKVLGGERGIPIDKNCRAAVLENASDDQKEVYKFVDMMSEISDTPVILDSPAQPEIKDLYYRIQTQVCDGSLSSKEGAKQFVEESKKILSRI